MKATDGDGFAIARRALAGLFALLLVGCPTPKVVAISDAEREVCEAQGCTVWTPAELEALLRRAWQGGYQAGYKSI